MQSIIARKKNEEKKYRIPPPPWPLFPHRPPARATNKDKQFKIQAGYFYLIQINSTGKRSRGWRDIRATRQPYKYKHAPRARRSNTTTSADRHARGAASGNALKVKGVAAGGLVNHGGGQAVWPELLRLALNPVVLKVNHALKGRLPVAVPHNHVVSIRRKLQHHLFRCGLKRGEEGEGEGGWRVTTAARVLTST